MKIWILGGQGFIGRALQKACMDRKIAWVASGREEADVLDLKRLIKMGDCVRPTHIINCAVYAGTELERAFAVNAEGAKNSALAAYELGAQLIHLSDDCVFDLLENRPYREDDPCRSLSVYGQSKLAGEQFVREVMPEACVLRTSWVFGVGGKNALSRWPKLFEEHEVIEAAIDEIGSPTYVKDFAEAILDMADKTGVYHFNNSGSCSRYEIALKLHEKLSARKSLKCKKIEPISMGPSYSVLDISTIEKALGKSPRNWNEGLEEFIEEL
jgi:dTDP-4-dehydrorhamnose reductase